MSGLPGTTSWRPATRLLSIITPMMRFSPPEICPAISAATSGWFSGFLLELAWLASTITCGATPDFASSLQAARNAFRVVVRLAAAAQDDVAVLVARRRGDRRAAALGHRHEMMRMRGRLHRVGRDAHIAVGAVLEADRAGQPEASSRWIWLSVVRAPIAAQDTRSAMYCGVVMSRNSVPAGRPRLLTADSTLARKPQALVDVEAAVEIGIVDQASSSRPWCRGFSK